MEVLYFFIIFVVEIKTNKIMLERLKICWYVLTRHTYAVFFCSKNLKHQECYSKNTFDVFDESIVEFVGNKYNVIKDK